VSERIFDHPVLGALKENECVKFSFNDKEHKGLKGESLAAALLANGIRTLRHHEESGTPRGIYCNIGHCFECRVTVNGRPGVRACLTPLEEGMVVESGGKLPTPIKDWRNQHE